MIKRCTEELKARGMTISPPPPFLGPSVHDAASRLRVALKRLLTCYLSEALDQPFLLLPFRPSSNPSAVRTFIRHFFDQNQTMKGETLLQELRMNEPMVCCVTTLGEENTG